MDDQASAPGDVFRHLDRMNISHSTEWHPAAFTVEDAKTITHHIPGGHTKNLLLECKQGNLWLVVCLDDQRLKVNGLSRLLGLPRLSFASVEKMKQRLGVEPGSVSPLALIRDIERVIKPIFDEKLFSHDFVNVHPLTNEATTTIRSVDLQRFVETLGYQLIKADLDATLGA